MLLMATNVMGQERIPASVSELKKWEKNQKAKAQEGDADACRLLALSNPKKYESYKTRALELYEKQQTGEAYYHMAELMTNDAPKRTSYLKKASNMGYGKAKEQLEIVSRRETVVGKAKNKGKRNNALSLMTKTPKQQRSSKTKSVQTQKNVSPEQRTIAENARRKLYEGRHQSQTQPAQAAGYSAVAK